MTDRTEGMGHRLAPINFQSELTGITDIQEKKIDHHARGVLEQAASCMHQTVDIEGTQVVLRRRKASQPQEHKVENIGPRIDPTLKRKEEAAVARFVLNHPSQEAKNVVRQFFTNLGEMVEQYHLTTNDFEVMVSSVPDARSRFSLKQAPDPTKRKKLLSNLVYTLKNFKKIPDKKFDKHFMQYASDMVTLATAIGYQAQGISKTADKSEQLSTFIKTLSFDAPKIGSEFPDRSKKTSYQARDTTSGIIIPSGIQEPVEKGLAGTQPGLPPLSILPGTYITKALTQGISMRNDVSGSAGLSLGAMRSVFEKGVQTRKMDDTTVMQCGGVLCATYMLGDFHSFTETAAGVSNFYQNYTQNINFRPQEQAKLQEISPKTFLGLSSVYLSSIVADESLPEFNIMMQDVLEEVKDA